MVCGFKNLDCITFSIRKAHRRFPFNIDRFTGHLADSISSQSYQQSVCVDGKLT